MRLRLASFIRHPEWFSEPRFINLGLENDKTPISMKKSILPILVLTLVLPYLATAQGVDGVKPARNSIVITPLGDLLNNSKSSIYYRRVLKSNSNKYLSLRLGTELFKSIKNEFSSGREEQSKSSNFKWGLEMGKEMDRMMVLKAR